MNTEELRAEFWQCQAEVERIEASSASLREQRDAIFAHIEASRANAKLLSQQITEAENGLFELKMHLAAVARALKGQTGERPAEILSQPRQSSVPWWKRWRKETQ